MGSENKIKIKMIIVLDWVASVQSRQIIALVAGCLPKQC